MKVVIYKYHLTPRTTLELPLHSQFLSTLNQNDNPVIYFLIDQDVIATEIRKFFCVNTGALFDFPPFYSFLGTWQAGEGIVWHVFEDTTKE